VQADVRFNHIFIDPGSLLPVAVGLAALRDHRTEILVDAEPEFSGAQHLSHAFGNHQFFRIQHETRIRTVPHGCFTNGPWENSVLVG